LIFSTLSEMQDAEKQIKTPLRKKTRYCLAWVAGKERFIAFAMKRHDASGSVGIIGRARLGGFGFGSNKP
jgi:hypothetical protein